MIKEGLTPLAVLDLFLLAKSGLDFALESCSFTYIIMLLILRSFLLCRFFWIKLSRSLRNVFLSSIDRVIKLYWLSLSICLNYFENFLKFKSLNLSKFWSWAVILLLLLVNRTALFILFFRDSDSCFLMNRIFGG